MDRDRRLEILKDPRVGAFGATALILSLALIATSVAALPTEEAVKTLIVAHVLVALGDPARRLAAAREARWRRRPAARRDDAGLAIATLLAAAAAIAAGAAIALAAAALTAGRGRAPAPHGRSAASPATATAPPRSSPKSSSA